MSRHLFLLTVTPVQSFIRAARKTQDLYGGSYILSHLCRVAIYKAKKNYNAKIIFPHTDLKSLPNRLLAVFDMENDEKLKDIGLDIEQTILKEFSTMADQIICSLDLPLHKDLSKQINNYFQVYWAFYPLEEKTYAEAYKQIEDSLSSIKNVKRFNQLAEEGRKCTVTGEHNALYYKDNEEKSKKIKDAIPVHKRIPDKYLAPGEALGGIAFVKRCADRFFGEEFNSKFPSTSRVALMDALNKLAMKDSKYHDILDVEFDEQDIFNLKNGINPVNDQLAEEVYEQLKTYKITYSPYYAILLFDGDSMGTWLSGAKLKNGVVSLQEFHSQLSAKLGSFAKLAVEQVLVPPKGITVYAGGDDFLGLVNISYLLEVMKELREQFEHTIDLSEFTDEKLSFSAGVAVAHYKTPLTEVLSWARRMEKEAKRIDMSKDAFGLALLKHSGEINKSVYKWKCDGDWTTDLVNEFVSYIKNDFSSTFIRNFQFEFRPLMDDNGRLIPEKISDDMVKGEMKRLIDRAYLENNGIPKEQKRAEKEKKVNDFLASLWKLYLSSRYFNNFLSLLDFAVFMEREVNDSA